MSTWTRKRHWADGSSRLHRSVLELRLAARRARSIGAERDADGDAVVAHLQPALAGSGEVAVEHCPVAASRLEGDGQAGALCLHADIAADALGRFRNGVSPDHASRVAPMLRARREAGRDRWR